MHDITPPSLITAPFRHPFGWAAAAPAACAVHCAAMPIVAVAAPSMVSGGGIEWGLLGLTLVFSAVALTFGVRTHGSLSPLAPVAIGVVIWGGALFFLHHIPAFEFTTMAASILVASGLLWNSRMCCVSKEAGCLACHDHAHGESDEVEAIPERSA